MATMKIPAGEIAYTCFSSDFFLDEVNYNTIKKVPISNTGSRDFLIMG